VPNRYVAKLAAENERVLFGASIHPYRLDWRDELAFCLENRAVLCKWIPSSQLIDPLNQHCDEFYDKLAEHNLPLLYHAGPEYAIPTSNHEYDEFNNPKYLKTILDKGVTVIIAHCTMPFWGDLDIEYQDDFTEFLKLFEEAESKDWKLYADLSAICSPLRNKYVQIIKARLAEITPKRLIYASDYPIPLSELCYQKSTNFFAWLIYVFNVARTKNYLDKNYLLIKGMDFKEKICSNAPELFSMINYGF